MKLAKVKNGIVGLGMVCDSHIKAYLSDPNAEVVAVCDLDGARAKAVAAEFGIRKTYTSYDEMLKDDEINTIDITTPTVLHAPMSIAAARAGKNILCEKPFCLTLAYRHELRPSDQNQHEERQHSSRPPTKPRLRHGYDEGNTPLPGNRRANGQERNQKAAK